MLGVSSVCSDAPATAAPSATEANESGGGGGPSSGGILLSEEEKLRIEDGDRSSGGNRWPRQETLALLKIRSDMDVVFRDSSLKGPLWEEVSRKLAELGFQRSAKKCKEKFENVYKYHRRTKEGRSTKPDGKAYRFFDQLEALENQPPPIPLLAPPPPPPRPQIQQQPTAAIPVAAAAPAMSRTTNPPTVQPISSTVPSAAPNPITVPQNTLAQTSINPTNPSPQSQSNLLPTTPTPLPPSSSSVPMTITAANPISISYNYATIPSCPHPNMSATMNFASISTSSSTSSDEEPERRCKRKRKWGDFFQRLMSEVIHKQEEMQRKFLETLEKRERDRVAREEAWRVQEMVRMNREHELLVQERSVAAAKDAAVIAFLQKISDQEIPNIAQMQMHFKDIPISLPSVPPPPPPQPQPVVVLQPQAQGQPPPALQQQQQQQQQPVQTLVVKRLENPKLDNGGENFAPSSNSSSRWPKAEVQALIRLRTNMDNKYQENGPKGPLWEEISAAMRKIGYDRSAKRCKEKWENINKYFKKVKESNKKRPEDSKTCPYFHQLDALYKEKAKTDNTSNNISSFNHGFAVKPENPMVPIMVQPEQQWPLQQEHHHGQESEMEGHDSDNFDDDDDDDGDDEDGDDEVSGYEIVTNKPASVGTVNE